MATKPKRVIRRPSSSPLPWIITVVAAVALGLVVTLGRRDAKSGHPEPRANAASLGESVMPATFFTENPGVLRTYQLAREIPATLDALYCHCHCHEDAGHRSLLTCFQSEHGAGCDICLGEADMAHQMQAQGKSIRDIRQQIDLAFGR